MSLEFRSLQPTEYLRKHISSGFRETELEISKPELKLLKSEIELLSK